MKTLTALCVLLLAGCAMTPTQKRVAAAVGAAMIAGAVASHSGNKVPDLSEMTPAHPKGCPSGPPKSREFYFC